MKILSPAGALEEARDAKFVVMDRRLQAVEMASVALQSEVAQCVAVFKARPVAPAACVESRALAGSAEGCERLARCESAVRRADALEKACGWKPSPWSGI